jgi:hypothetical protein
VKRGEMCAQPSLPVVPDNSAAPRGDDGGRSEDPEGRKKPGVGLGPKKPAVRLGPRKPGVALGPRPPGSGNELLLQPPKKLVQKVCSSFLPARTHRFAMLHFGAIASMGLMFSRI